MSRKTPAELDAAQIIRWEAMDRNKHPDSFLVAATDERCPAPLMTSAWDDCLTHLARFASVYVLPTLDGPAEIVAKQANPTGHAVCGIMLSRARWITIDDASGFVCAICIDRAEDQGRPTFGMIPDTGCAVSNGKRGHTLARRLHHNQIEPTAAEQETS